MKRTCDGPTASSNHDQRGQRDRAGACEAGDQVLGVTAHLVSERVVGQPPALGRRLGPDTAVPTMTAFLGQAVAALCGWETQA